MDLKICSFNCNSFRKHTDIIKNIVKNNDIILIQEIMLLRNDIDIVSCINENYDFVITASTYNENEICPGRPQGGLIIFFKKTLSRIIKPVSLTNRLLGIKIQNGNDEILLINSYFPCEYNTHDSLCAYRSTIVSISEIIENENFSQLIIAGDINADPSGGRFWTELQEFMTEQNMICADVCSLPADSFTYLSACHTSTSRWLDHVISSNNDLVFDIRINLTENFVDHFPVEFKIHVNLLDNIQVQNINIKEFIKWNNMTSNNKFVYNSNVKNSLDNYICATFFCNTKNCNNVEHKKQIDEAFTYIKNVLGTHTADFKVRNQHKNKTIPGWNEHCRILHMNARAAFLQWVINGKVRHGVDFHNMKHTRHLFKSAFDRCKKDEKAIRCLNLLNSFKIKNKSNFWRDVKKLKGKAQCFASNIDGKSDPKGMVNVFNEKFKKIFDDKECQSDTRNIGQKVPQLRDDGKFRQFNRYTLRNAIDNLNDGIGIDNIHSNHLKFAKTGVDNFLSKLFNAIILHSYFPDEMLVGQIRPLVKDHKGDLSSPDNYRPIMVSSNFLKIFEYSILTPLNNCIKLDFRQLGFRNKTSTTMATALLKETISNYVKKNSSVYCSFLDMSKAFDKINHFTLIDKLYKKIFLCVL
jgi:hypothetical protein